MLIVTAMSLSKCEVSQKLNLYNNNKKKKKKERKKKEKENK